MGQKVETVKELIEKYGNAMREHDFMISTEYNEDAHMNVYIEETGKWLVILKDSLKDTMQLKMNEFVNELNKTIQEGRYDISD